MPYGAENGRVSRSAPQKNSRRLPAGSSALIRWETRRSASSSAPAGFTAVPDSSRTAASRVIADGSATSQPEAASRSRSPAVTTIRAGRSSIRR
ncbi:hypothetical protein MB27_17265 [Actinoplanes utahensis]|uniref:Uncharacterized protein n=1 Tax=Actinoplanes utahensis TaxID=1869 RepID=A0A0A6UQ17_ACTUT|nr:hypothetical protein MB27_17265 [Actinoplanes utahensis]